jgi:phosphoglycolate phosphatase
VTGARPFRLLVFDWDGTIADSAATIAWSIQEACRDVGEPVPDSSAARYVIGLGLADAIRHVAPGLAPARYQQLADRYRTHYLARDADIPLFAGMSELLAELERKGYLLAVATGKSRRGLDRALEQAGLAARFVATRCADEGFPKPHPDMLLHLMERLGMYPEHTLMIGDTTHDLELARNAGVDAVAVTYGAHDRQTLEARAPLVAAGSVDDLRRWLAGLPAPEW